LNIEQFPAIQRGARLSRCELDSDTVIGRRQLLCKHGGGASVAVQLMVQLQSRAFLLAFHHHHHHHLWWVSFSIRRDAKSVLSPVDLL